jgi:putative ABC transport system ATP-binding protein
MGILTLQDVNYRYENSTKNVLKGINIEFEEGKLYSLIGKSGAGKSTLLSMISGLDLCSEGNILFKGNDLRKVNRDVYRSIDVGVIFQSYNLLTNATAVENIILSMEISRDKRKSKKQIAYELLEKVGIDKETANRKILKLSGGEQQRVGISRALSHNPDIIIADEPTGNLDGDSEKNIMDILTSLAHEENKCVIVVTHSNQVSSYADEIWGLTNGKLMFIKENH